MGNAIIKTNLPSFLAQMDAMDAKAQKLMEQFFRLLALKLFRMLILGTPVDTSRARGGWQLGVNHIPIGIFVAPPASQTKKRSKKKRRKRLPGMNADGARALKAGMQQGQTAHYWDILYFANNVPHMRFLEGLDVPKPVSPQAPKGVVGPAIKRLTRSFRRPQT